MDSCPAASAPCWAVLPVLLRKVLLAPNSSSSLQRWLEPRYAARCSAVSPFWLWALTSAPLQEKWNNPRHSVKYSQTCIERPPDYSRPHFLFPIIMFLIET